MSNQTKNVGFQNKENKALTLKTNHILVIGIDNYSYQSPLQNPVDDCKKIIKVLCERYRFEEEHIKTIYNEEATRENILDALEEYEKLTETDNLLILFSGHGHYRENGNAGFWIPVNAKKRAQYISNEDIKEHIRACQAHHIALIVDSCFSGAMTRKVSQQKSSIDTLAAIRSYKRKSRWAMTSGRIELVYDGNAGQNSPFARGIISELENNEKGMLLFSELGGVVRHITNRNADQDPSCSYLRDVGDMNGEFSFVLKDFQPMEEETEETNGNLIKIISIPLPDEEEKLEAPAEAKLDRIDEIKKDLRKWLIAAELKKVYEYLVEIMDEDSSLKSTVYNRFGGWNNLQNNIARGTAMNVSQQEAEHRQAIDYIISNLTKDDLKK